jgi:molecular chaperone DnaJ
MFGQFINVTMCNVCHGEGRIIKEKCDECHGEGRIKTDTTIKINVPAREREMHSSQGQEMSE